MADYFPLVEKAIQSLERNTAHQREMLYGRARSALITALQSVTPPLDEKEIARERLALEKAIRRVEEQSTVVAILNVIPISPLTRSNHLPPPALAEFLLALFTKPSHREGILQAAEEAYFRNLDNKGQRRATCLYWSSAIRSVAPLAWRLTKRVGWVSAMIAAAMKMLR